MGLGQGVHRTARHPPPLARRWRKAVIRTSCISPPPARRSSWVPTSFTYRSTDGGATFVRVSDTFPDEAGGATSCRLPAERRRRFGRIDLSAVGGHAPRLRAHLPEAQDARPRRAKLGRGAKLGTLRGSRAAALRCSSPRSQSTTRTRSIWRGPIPSDGWNPADDVDRSCHDLVTAHLGYAARRPPRRQGRHQRARARAISPSPTGVAASRAPSETAGCSRTGVPTRDILRSAATSRLRIPVFWTSAVNPHDRAAAAAWRVRAALPANIWGRRRSGRTDRSGPDSSVWGAPEIVSLHG